MRSASPRVAHANWSGPGTAQMPYDGVAFDSLLWITTSPVSGMLSGMVASRNTHMNVLLIRPTVLQNDLECGRLGASAKVSQVCMATSVESTGVPALGLFFCAHPQRVAVKDVYLKSLRGAFAGGWYVSVRFRLTSVAQHDTQERAVHFQGAVVVDEPELPKLVHEEVDARSCRADHLRQDFLRQLRKSAVRRTCTRFRLTRTQSVRKC